MDRLGVSLARAESVAGVVFEAKSVTGANQVESELNINSNLDRDQQASLLELLVENSDVFATNPKSPNTTHVAHHVNNTNGQLPIKEKNIRVSPNRTPNGTKNCTRQAQDPVIASAVKPINTTGSIKDRQLKKHAGLHLRESIIWKEQNYSS